MSMVATTTLTPRRVNGVLRRAGIPAGYCYLQSGIYRSDGTPVRELGTMSHRRVKGRYGAQEDLGGVRVFCIDPQRPAVDPPREFIEKVGAALRAVFPNCQPYRLTGFFIPDEPPEEG